MTQSNEEQNTELITRAEINSDIISYDEAIDGDISDDPNNPLSFNVSEVTIDPPPPALPTVSFEVLPTTLSEEAENNLVEWKWTVTGDFPAEGLVVNLDTLGENDVTFFTEQFAATPAAEFVNADIVGFEEETGRLNILLTQPEGAFNLYIFNDIIEEGTQPFEFQLAEGEGYLVDPDKNSTLFTITDDNGGPGVGPLVGISASPINLVEGDELTLNFTVDGEIPEGGLQILVQSSAIGSLGQLDVSDLTQLEYTGIEGLPSVADSTGSSFFVTIVEPTASIKVGIFDDILEEEPLEVPFALANGEEYEVDPNASSVTLTISDEPQPVGPTIGLTIDKTDVVEGDSVTFTFTVDGEIPEGGIQVLVDDVFSAENQRRALTEFDVEVSDVILTGISEFPTAAEGDSGFFANIVESTATITLRVSDEGIDEDEATESFTYELIEGEAYQVDPNASGFTLNISDVVDAGGVPTISIDTVTVTLDPEDNIITSNLVESIEGGTPILSVSVSSDVPIPEEGLVVNVNTDLADLTKLVAEPAFAPFTFGGEFLGAIYNDENVATGFQVKLNNPNATVNFLGVGLETEGAQDITLSVEPGDGYTVSDTKDSATVTIYDTLDQVPTSGSLPTIGMSISETSLIEGGNRTTISFNVDGDIPTEGIAVFLDSGVRGFLGELDGFNSIVEGGAFPVTNGNASGFYFKITEPTASITLIPIDDNLDPDTGEQTTEGIEAFSLTLREQGNYLVDSNAAVVNFTIADDANAKIQVSLTTSPETLIEESGTVSAHTFTLSAPPPQEGITISVLAEGLEDFDLTNLETTGIAGEVLVGESFPPQLIFTIVEQTATINLPIANDGIAEGMETAVFTLLEPGENANYQISLDPQANKSSFAIYDTLNEAPVIVEDAESNDTIATSIPIAINGDRNQALVLGAINFDFRNNRDVDQTEDVDMYSVELQAGDRITIDLDSIPFENSAGFTLRNSGDLRIFNAAGEELVYNDEGSAPGELFQSRRDAYIDFTAESAGTYYLGVSQAFNENYDPNVKGTGDGALLPPRFGIGAGEYELEVEINPDAPTFEQYVEFDGQSPDGPVVKFVAATGTFQGNDVVSSQIVESLGVGRGQAAVLNLTFSVEGEIPEGGLEVILKSDTDFTDFLDDLTGTPRIAVGGEVLGAVYNEDGTPAGLKVLITSPNASFPFPVSDREDDDPNIPESIEFSLANSPDYAVNTETNSSIVTFYDTLDQVPTSGSIPQVSVTNEQSTLIESEGTVTNFTFNVEGDIPEDGLLLYLDSETRSILGEFNVFDVEVTGGAFPSTNGDASGFYFSIFENNANIKISAIDESINPLIPPEDALEGIEEFTFSLVGTNEYAVNPDSADFTFTIADNPDSVVLPEEPEMPGIELPTDNDGRETNNDTIANAVPLGLNLAADNFSVTIDGEISERFRGDNAVDDTEDVDMYSFDLQAGQTITIDVDSSGIGDAGLGTILDSTIRIFDVDGNEIAINNQGAATDEIFQAEGDPYLEFTASEAGTYYAGISALGNDFYDPNVANSGSGWTFGERFGGDIYRATFSLGDDMVVNPEPPMPPMPPIFGGVDEDVIEVSGSNQLIFAGDADDLIDASIGSEGGNRIYAGSGNDTLILGTGDRALGGAGDDIFFTTSGGDNTLTGGAGADQFWIAVAEVPEAVNIITDFTISEDVLGIAGLGIGFSDLRITDTDNGTLIAFDSNDLALITNVSADLIASEDNFAFG